jgi:hypothetical protein
MANIWEMKVSRSPFMVKPILHSGLFCTTTDPMHFPMAHCCEM